VVERNRYFLLALLACAGLGAMAFALAALTPLKTVVPYVVHVADNGSAALAPASAQRYSPGPPERAYFLAKWVTNLMTLDTYVTERNLAEAYAQTSGVASNELVDWLKSQRPVEAVKKDPSLVRTVAINTVTALEEGIMQVRVRTETRSLSRAPESRPYQVTIHYVIVPPKTEAYIIKNPIRLVIPHFSINEELAG
jgi:type IV secretory pathway TrbF-like protein